MWEHGLPDGQEKERQKLTRVMMVSDTHMEHLSHRCSGGRRRTFRRGRAVLGWETPFVNVSIFYPPRGGWNNDYWSVDNTEKNSSESNLSKNYHLSEGWGNEAMAKSPSFTEFFAQII